MRRISRVGLASIPRVRWFRCSVALVVVMIFSFAGIAVPWFVLLLRAGKLFSHVEQRIRLANLEAALRK
jgi:hypothetical protein